MKLDDIQVLQYEGKDKLPKFLKTLRLIPGFSEVRSLGITRDADESFDAASDSIQASISKNQLYEVNDLKIETFIFPNNCSSGMLEDIFIQSIDPAEISCIDNLFDCIKNQTQRVQNHISKARINAWLSSQTKPGKRLGEAAQAGYFDFNHEAFKNIISFIQSL